MPVCSLFDAKKSLVAPQEPSELLREHLASLVGPRSLPLQKAARLQPLYHAADGRAVEADGPSERCLVDARAVADDNERAVLRRREPVGCALFDKNADRDLVRTA